MPEENLFIIKNYNNKNFKISTKLIVEIRNIVNINRDLLAYLYGNYKYAKNNLESNEKFEYIAFMLYHLFFTIDPSYEQYELIKILFLKIFFGQYKNSNSFSSKICELNLPYEISYSFALMAGLYSKLYNQYNYS